MMFSENMWICNQEQHSFFETAKKNSRISGFKVDLYDFHKNAYKERYIAGYILRHDRDAKNPIQVRLVLIFCFDVKKKKTCRTCGCLGVHLYQK